MVYTYDSGIGRCLSRLWSRSLWVTQNSKQAMIFSWTSNFRLNSSSTVFSAILFLLSKFIVYIFQTALGGAFIVIYNEVELLNDTTFERGWSTFVAYGGSGALVFSFIFLFIRTICFQTKEDKSNTLMLRRASWIDPKYQPTHQYLHSVSGIDNRFVQMPPPYTTDVNVRQYGNWIDRWFLTVLYILWWICTLLHWKSPLEYLWF